jgi:iron complex outermembrane recepter protein
MRFANGVSAHDASIMGQTGFRLDSALSDQNSATVQGDFYDGRYGRNGFRDTVVDGANLITRFTRKVDEGSELQLQAFYDHTHRRVYGQFEKDLHTFDFDALYRRELNERNEIMTGINYRLYDDHIVNPIPNVFGFFPGDRTIQYFNGFLQYEYKLVPEKLAATVGAKLEHNDFSGFEYQPGARLAWTPSEANTIWAGISRAVRTPTRFDEDLRVTVPGFVLIPQRDFKSEKVLAYELGWRMRPSELVAFDIAGFFNDYSDLRSQEAIPGPPGSITLRNLFHGEGYGVESGVDLEPLSWWHLRLNYTYFEKQIYPRINSTDRTRGVAEGNDPHHFGSVRSSWDLPQNLFFDAIGRYVSHLPAPRVPGYVELDFRLAWRPKKNLELAISGLNLLHDSHEEFGPATATREEVERSGYFEVTWSF